MFSPSIRARRSFVPRLDVLEDRTVPSTFTVTNLADGGPGSLRQAVLDANGNPGADVIQFALRLPPFAWMTPSAMRAAIGVMAFPMSIWPQAMSYLRPSRAVALVSPVMACLVEVYGAELGRGAWAEIEPLLMILPPRGSWSFMILNASRVQ